MRTGPSGRAGPQDADTPAKGEVAGRERCCGSCGTCWSEICRADLSPPGSPGSPRFCSGVWNPTAWDFVVLFPEARARPAIIAHAHITNTSAFSSSHIFSLLIPSGLKHIFSSRAYRPAANQRL